MQEAAVCQHAKKNINSLRLPSVTDEEVFGYRAACDRAAVVASAARLHLARKKIRERNVPQQLRIWDLPKKSL